MKFVHRASDFAEVKQQFLDAVVETIEMEEVCPELMMNGT